MMGRPGGWKASLSRVGRMAMQDLRLTLRDRASIIWMLLLPVAFMWLFGHTGSSSTQQPQIALAVEDQDGGWLARSLVDELTVEHVRLEEVGSQPALDGEDAAPRVLIIPAGFTAGALAGEQQTLRLEAETEANPTFTLAAQAVIFRASVRLVSRMAELASTTPEGEDVNARMTPEAYSLLAERPPKVVVEASDAGRGQPVPQGTAQSVPGTLTFIVLMMTLIYGAIFLTKERQQGMLKRQATLPLRPSELLLGKLGGRLLIAAAQIVLLLVVGSVLFGVSWGSHPGALVTVLFSYALAVAGLSLLLGATVSTAEQASSVGWILSMILGSLGGCWWPSEIMPQWLQTAAFAFPTAWAMNAFHALISFGRGWEAVWLPSLVLLGFGFASTLLGARKLRYD